MFNLQGHFTSIALLVADKGDFHISDEDDFYEAREKGPVFVWLCPYSAEISGRVLVQWDIELQQAKDREYEARQDI